MKKFGIMILAALLLMGSLGCAGEPEDQASMGFSEAQTAREGRVQGESPRQDTPAQSDAAAEGAAPSEEQSRETAAKTVVGRVDSIIGNEVVLAIGTVDSSTSAAGAEPADGGETPAMDGRDQGGRRAGGGEMPDGMGEAPSGEMPDGMPGGEMPQSGDMGGGTGRVNVTYTGETATYLLPVGMAIGAGDFTSVSEGMVLELRFNGEDTITAVSILSR